MPSSDVAEARRRFAAARVAVLATVGESGAPHLVPVTFVLEEHADRDAGGRAPGDPLPDTVWTAVDGKPKASGPLRRHRNIEARPAVSLLVQHWDEDWSELWWVRADGVATLHESSAVTERVTALLRAKYPQYREDAGGVAVTPPVIAVAVHTFRGWRARADA